MAEQMVSVNGVELCVQTFGNPADQGVLLIAGAASSMDYWEPDFCERLADDRFVIRYDHRDTGRSTTCPPGEPDYEFPDLTHDAVALIDHLARGKAHVVGLSMGGGMAQDLAIRFPDRVASLTLMSTSSGFHDDLPPMSEELKQVFADPAPEPNWDDEKAVIDYLVEAERPYAPTSFDEVATRAVIEKVVRRAVNPHSATNHWQLSGGEETRPRLGEISVPTLVVHGTDDPLLPPGHPEALAAEIPGAELLVLDGVGHQWPPRDTWDVVVPAIKKLQARKGT